MFITGNRYSKKDIYKILNVPIEQQGGNWNTGYTSYENNIYIFCNIGVPGRTGHNYDNHWENDNLVWYGKSGSKSSQPFIKRLISHSNQIHIFTRTNSSFPFTYEGKSKAENFDRSTPIKITWSFPQESSFNHPSILSEEVKDPLYEGCTVSIRINKYERNRAARQICIDFFGYICQVCDFNFEQVYGEAGKDFIHVHHLKLLSEIKEKYIVDPINDLRPICPNCHAIIHKKNPCYTIDEIRLMIETQKKLNKISLIKLPIC